jgi:transketolase
VGNGGGYGYGPMGFTHHALEDYGILLTMPNLRVFVPSFSDDMTSVVAHLSGFEHPSYLRLGNCEKPKDYNPQPYAPWRKILDGSRCIILTIGPLAGGLIKKLQERPRAMRPSLWLVSELPIERDSLPEMFLDELKTLKKLCVVEEHVLQGSVGQALSHALLSMGIELTVFRHFYAQGYPSRKNGSQVFHRKESEIDSDSVIQYIDRLSGYKDD